MRVMYDSEVDALTIVFREVQVAESDDVQPGSILDYDDAGNIVGVEILDASERVERTEEILYAPPPGEEGKDHDCESSGGKVKA